VWKNRVGTIESAFEFTGALAGGKISIPEKYENWGYLRKVS